MIPYNVCLLISSCCYWIVPLESLLVFLALWNKIIWGRQNRVYTHLKSPWKSLNFKMKIQGLESPWKLQWVLESPWISVLTLSNLDFHVPKRSKHAERPSNCSCCQTELKIDIHSSLFFASNGVLEKWEMCPWKVLEFFVQKRVQTVAKNCHTTLLYSYQVIIHLFFSFHL